MEQDAVYQQFDGTQSWWKVANQPVRGIRLAGFLCPSDNDVPIFNVAQDFGFRGNYAANTGVGKWNRTVPLTAAAGGYQPGLTARGVCLHGIESDMESLAI